MRFTTSFNVPDQAELTLHCDEERGVNSLLAYLHEEVESGIRFLPGETLEFGWSFLRLESRAGELTLLEPDWRSFPIEWVPSVTHAMRHAYQQLEVARSVGLEEVLEFRNWRHSAIVCSNFGTEAGRFMLQRSEATTASDSGWYVGCIDQSHDHNDPENLTLSSLFEIGLSEPEAVCFFALPTGTTVVLDGGNLGLARDSIEVAFSSTSYLGRNFRVLSDWLT